MATSTSTSTTAGNLRVAILDDYQGVALDIADWEPVRKRVAAIDVFRDTVHDEDEIVKRLEPYDILCTMRERTKLTRSVLERLPNLKFISTTGLRNRGIDHTFALTRGISVSGTGNGGNPTLEHIWALLLALVRHIPSQDAHFKSRSPHWQTGPLATGLQGRTLGLLGVGRLGGQVATIAKAFGMHVVGWSPNLTRDRAEGAGVEFAETKEKLLEQSDILSIHLVLSPSTHHILKLPDLLRLKPSAYLLNTSRGPLVDEAALIQVLKEGRIRGAGLDVYDVEPLPVDHELRGLGDRVVLTPHSAYVADENYEVFYRETVENVLAFLDGKPVRVYE